VVLDFVSQGRLHYINDAPWKKWGGGGKEHELTVALISSASGNWFELIISARIVLHGIVAGKRRAEEDHGDVGLTISSNGQTDRVCSARKGQKHVKSLFRVRVSDLRSTVTRMQGIHCIRPTHWPIDIRHSDHEVCSA